MRFPLLSISLPSSSKRQREIAKFEVFLLYHVNEYSATSGNRSELAPGRKQPRPLVISCFGKEMKQNLKERAGRADPFVLFINPLFRYGIVSHRHCPCYVSFSNVPRGYATKQS